MREGAVEPGEYCKKAALDQERINKIKSKLLQHIYKKCNCKITYRIAQDNTSQANYDHRISSSRLIYKI